MNLHRHSCVRHLLAGQWLFREERLRFASFHRLKVTIPCHRAITVTGAVQALQELPSRRGQLALQLPDGPLLFFQQLLVSKVCIRCCAYLSLQGLWQIWHGSRSSAMLHQLTQLATKLAAANLRSVI